MVVMGLDEASVRVSKDRATITLARYRATPNLTSRTIDTVDLALQRWEASNIYISVTESMHSGQ
jgi:hypothetical protein